MVGIWGNWYLCWQLWDIELTGFCDSSCGLGDSDICGAINFFCWLADLMGNKSSSPRDEGSWRQASRTQSSSSSGWQHDYAHSTFSQYAQNYPKPHQPSTTGSSSSSGLQHDDIQSSHSQDSQSYPVAYPYTADYPPAGYPPTEQYYAPPQDYVHPSPVPAQYDIPISQVHAPKKKLDKRYSKIADNYRSLDEVRVVFCARRPQI